MRSMTLNQIAQWINCSSLCPHFVIQGYSIDSRQVKPGELFFALKGEKVDGHDFLSEAKAKGAVAAVVSRSYQGESFGLILLAVEDPLHALQDLAKNALMRHSTRIVAITGSVGKTSTKEFTKALLAKKYCVAASPGNSNSQVGVPLTILNHTTGDEEILVLEMGMTLPGQIARLVQIAPPEVALVTTVTLVHACNFDSLEDIAWAKAEIFSHPQTRLGILPSELPFFELMSRNGNCHKISFSIQTPKADYWLDEKDQNFLHARLEKFKVQLPHLNIPGKHNWHNLLAAIAIARHFKVSWEQIDEAISSLQLPEKRLQFVEHKNILFLNDSYNACELSVKAALETLPAPKEKGRKIAVLGSMFELGKFSDECHRRVGEFALNHVEELYCLGDECLPLYEVWQQAGRSVQFFKQRDELVEHLRQSLQSHDVVLLKGSRAKEMWKVLEEL